MNSNMPAVIAIGSSLITYGAFAADAEPQSADAVKAAVVGNTDCGANAEGADTCIDFAPDGTMSGKSGVYTSKDKYEIKDDGSICAARQRYGQRRGERWCGGYQP